MSLFKRSRIRNPALPQEPRDYAARGWLEGYAEMEFRDGFFMFDREPRARGLTFAMVETHERNGDVREQYPFWSDILNRPSQAKRLSIDEIDWVRLCDRKTYPNEMQDFHWEVFASSNDPQLISGHFQLKSGKDWFFSLIGDEQFSSAQWLTFLQDSGTKILDPQSTD